MKFVFTSYSSSQEYTDPEAWLKRIEGYTGILASLGREHAVTGIERISHEGWYHQDGVQYYFIRLKNKTVRFPLRMHRLIKELQPDIVFVNGFIFPLQIIQLKLVLGRKVKIIILHRAEKPFKGIKKYLQKIADRCVDAYLFCSLDFREQWKYNISTRKIYEIIQASSHFYPADPLCARHKTGVSGSPVFLWVASLIPRKDPVTVVKAFLEFIKYQPGAKLYMIYQQHELLGELKRLLDKQEESMHAVIFVSSVINQELLHWYNSADFFITGSRYEGSGVALSEAMSCGCIPVATNIPSFRMMTGNGECGMLYEPGDETALLRALIRTQAMNIKEEKEKTRARFQKELSFDAIARKISGIAAQIKS